MKWIWEEAKAVLQSRVYLICIGFVAFCAYGYEFAHLSIGIDDTAIALYFDDGLAPVMGRWVLFLLNRILCLSQYTPLVPEAVATLLLCLSAVLCCVLWKRIMGEWFDCAASIFFSCLFISYPLISFVFRYYLHNGLGLGNLFTVLALLLYQDQLRKPISERIKGMFFMAVLLWMAIGCYESFIILWLLGILTVLFLEAAFGNWELKFRSLLKEFCIVVMITLFSMVLRTLMIRLIALMFQLEQTEITTVGLRSVTEAFALLAPDGLATFHMLIKRFWLVYHLSAFAFFPITVYELSCVVFCLSSVILLVRRKTLWYLVLYVLMLVTPFLMVIIEAKNTFYRSCQYLPFFSALGIALFYVFIKKYAKGKLAAFGKGFFCVLASILIYRQVSWISADFWMEHKEYEYSKQYLIGASQEVIRRYGNEKPVVFVGGFDLPHEFVKNYYIPYSDPGCRLMIRIMDLVDVYLKDKYSSPYGLCLLNEGTVPSIRWAFDAFDGTNREMIQFLRMEGYDFKYLNDAEEYRELRREMDHRELPKWPMEGSVFEENGYVFVHF